MAAWRAARRGRHLLKFVLRLMRRSHRVEGWYEPAGDGAGCIVRYDMDVEREDCYMGERLPLVVEGRYEYLTVSWTRARSVGVLDTIQGILDEESRNAEILRSGTRMMYALSLIHI